MDLQRALREQASPTAPITDLLDLVALGTVADVVSWTMPTGCWWSRACGASAPARAARASARCCRWLVATPTGLAADMGFAVGPRLNAAGRLSDMTHGIACLLAETDAEATEMAQELDTINRERRSIEHGMRDAAMDRGVAAEPGQSAGGAVPVWQGMARRGGGHSRLTGKEAIHRPVIAFARPSSRHSEGSGRSIPGLHLRDALDAVATANPGC